MMTDTQNRYAMVFIGVLIAGASLPGCRQDTGTDPAEESSLQGRIEIAESPDAQPRFHFPPEVRSSDESLNTFIEEFTRSCIAGEYDRYRLYTSRQVEPVAKEQFEKVYRRVLQVDIREVRPLPPISDLPHPLWMITSHVHVRPLPGQSPDEPMRTVVILAFREQDQWVIAPAPRALRQYLDSQPASQPATQPSTRPITRPATQRP